MRILLASMALIALTSAAEAYCYTAPESARDGYAGNDLRRTICLQDELSRATSARALQSQLDAALGMMQRELQQQRLQQQQWQLQNQFPKPALP